MRDDDSVIDYGIDLLDTDHFQGIPKGTLLAIVSQPQVQSGLFLAHAANNRNTTYISSKRPEDVINKELYFASGTYDEVRSEPENVEIKDLHPIDPNQYSDEIMKSIDDTEEDSNIIINEFSSLSSEMRMMDFDDTMRKIQKKAEENNHFVIVNFIASGYSGLGEKEQQILDICDGVFSLETNELSGERITQLNIDKFRGVDELEEFSINLKIRDTVSVPSDRIIE